MWYWCTQRCITNIYLKGPSKRLNNLVSGLTKTHKKARLGTNQHLYLIHAVNTAGRLSCTHQCIVIAHIAPLVSIRGLTFHPLQCVQIFLKTTTVIAEQKWNRFMWATMTHQYVSRCNRILNLYFMQTIHNFITIRQIIQMQGQYTPAINSVVQP